MSNAPAAPPEAGPAASDTLSDRYAKTDAGHAEVRGRTQALSRQARNLLLIIEPGRPATAWMAMVQGCGLPELQALLAAGLVAPVTPLTPVAQMTAATPTAPATGGAPAAAVVPASASADSAATLARLLPPARIPLSQALAQRGYRTLYDRITALARPQLGLFKGYRLILEVERCSGPDEVRALALRFVEQVREADGEAAAQALAERLAAPE